MSKIAETFLNQLKDTRNNELKSIFSPQIAELIIQISDVASSAAIRRVEKGIDHQTALMSIAEEIEKIDLAHQKVMMVEMGEVDEGFIKTRKERFLEVITAFALGVTAYHLMDEEEEMSKTLDSLNMESLGLPKEICDQNNAALAARKRSDAADEEYRNLVKTMGENHPYTIEANRYRFLQLDKYREEVSKFTVLSAKYTGR